MYFAFTRDDGQRQYVNLSQALKVIFYKTGHATITLGEEVSAKVPKADVDRLVAALNSLAVNVKP